MLFELLRPRAAFSELSLHAHTHQSGSDTRYSLAPLNDEDAF